MSTTDFLQLNESALFAEIRNSLPIEKYHTQNLMECKDDLLFVWNAKETSLMVMNWRLLYRSKTDDQQLQALMQKNEHSKNIMEYQTLIPSVHITFDVEHILNSHEGSLMALAGPRGVCVLELPQRYGSNGLFVNDKARIICRSCNLDDKLFGNNTHLYLRRLQWHYASRTDSHLLVLLSDNTIRVYNNFTLCQVWQVGPLPLQSGKNLNSSIIYALGETVVDFCIAPAVFSTTDSKEDDLQSNVTSNQPTMSKHPKNVLEWPIVLLRENGNIYILMAGLDTTIPQLQGPLTMSPSQSDNYGLDSCSLLFIPSLPPTLVVAETNGKLHHALLLESESAEYSLNEVDENLCIYPSKWTIHVLETVELELGLTKETDNSDGYNCPIHLKKDFINESRYFAYHNAGLHAITINFIDELQRFLENPVNTDLTSIITTESQAEYILCTKVNFNDDKKDIDIVAENHHANAILGFTIMQIPFSLVLLLSSGQLISLRLIIDPKLLNSDNQEYKKDETLNVDETKMYLTLDNENFVNTVKAILKREVSQPLLALDKSGKIPTSSECYEILLQMIVVLRTQYVKKHSLVSSKIVKRVNTLKIWIEQQKHDIEALEQERRLIRDRAHKLAEKYEELSERQQLLIRSCEDLMYQTQMRLPYTSMAQNEFVKEVERINEVTNKMQANIERLKETMKKQKYHISKHKERDMEKHYELSEAQEHTIKNILSQINTEIDGQVKDIKRITKVIPI